MNDYSEMSDFEINKAVAVLENKDWVLLPCVDDALFVNVETEDKDCYEYDTHQYNPCNNPADAWPIIIENRIGLVPVFTCNNRCFSLEPTEKWRAEKTDWSIEIEDRNPLRAAMILFLMMNKEIGK